MGANGEPRDENRMLMRGRALLLAASASVVAACGSATPAATPLTSGSAAAGAQMLSVTDADNGHADIPTGVDITTECQHPLTRDMFKGRHDGLGKLSARGPEVEQSHQPSFERRLASCRCRICSCTPSSRPAVVSSGGTRRIALIASPI